MPMSPSYTFVLLPFLVISHFFALNLSPTFPVLFGFRLCIFAIHHWLNIILKSSCPESSHRIVGHFRNQCSSTHDLICVLCNQRQRKRETKKKIKRYLFLPQTFYLAFLTLKQRRIVAQSFHYNYYPLLRCIPCYDLTIVQLTFYQRQSAHTSIFCLSVKMEPQTGPYLSKSSLVPYQ